MQARNSLVASFSRSFPSFFYFNFFIYYNTAEPGVIPYQLSIVFQKYWGELTTTFFFLPVNTRSGESIFTAPTTYLEWRVDISL